MGGLGRRKPEDFKHVEKFPYSLLAPTSVEVVNKTFKLPYWHWTHDQGSEGACEGFGNSMMMTLLNKKRYNPWWLWNQGKMIDEWSDTNPGDNNGTSGRAVCEVLKTQGHTLWKKEAPSLEHGIQEYRWATTVDEMRTGIANNAPIAIGVDWYENFDKPEKRSNGWWIGLAGSLGKVRGGHCVCVYGASDKKQAFRVKNSWGRNFPLVWLPYKTMEILLKDAGEACLITDRN